jgi:hypothetical protein
MASDMDRELSNITQAESMRVNGDKTFEKALGLNDTKMVIHIKASTSLESPRAEESSNGRMERSTRVSFMKE